MVEGVRHLGYERARPYGLDRTRSRKQRTAGRDTPGLACGTKAQRRFPYETKAINTRTEVGRAVLIPMEKQIQQRAYELYEQRRKTDGHDLDDWLQAECEIKGRQAKAATA
jgi:hypothetical protein